jgi:hypothetical protein
MGNFFNKSKKEEHDKRIKGLILDKQYSEITVNEMDYVTSKSTKELQTFININNKNLVEKIRVILITESVKQYTTY